MLSGEVVGRVVALARYPVKSTAGQHLTSAVVDERGLVHDRVWAVYTVDGGIASGKTTRRFRKVDGLLAWRATLPSGAEVPMLEAPGGPAFRVGERVADEALTRGLNQPLTLRREIAVAHHDEAPIHLVTTSSVRRVGQLAGGAIDARRLRANLIIDAAGDGFVEDGWCGADLAIGPQVVLRVAPGMTRCVMLDLPQAGVPAGPALLRTLGAEHDLRLGQQATVVRPGELTVGDIVRIRRR